VTPVWDWKLTRRRLEMIFRFPLRVGAGLDLADRTLLAAAPPSRRDGRTDWRETARAESRWSNWRCSFRSRQWMGCQRSYKTLLNLPRGCRVSLEVLVDRAESFTVRSDMKSPRQT
jgi:hypothetical protein